MGSLWLTTAESSSSPEGIEAYLEATSSDTVRSRSYTGKPARMLRNAWTDAWEDPNGPGPLGMPLQNILTAEANARIARAHRKDLVFAPVGQIVGSMNEVKPVRDVMFRLVEEYIEATERLAGSLTTPSPELTAPPIRRDRSGHPPGEAIARRVRVVDAHRGDRGRVRDEAARATSGRRSPRSNAPGGDPLRRWSAATPDEPVDGTGAALRVPQRRQGAHVDADDTAAVDAALDAADVRASSDDDVAPARRCAAHRHERW